MRRNLLALVAFALVFGLASQAFAWGRLGHQIVAEVALAHLSPRARAEIDRLLAIETGATLASVSTWADEVRSPSTARWHFVNFPAGTCQYVPERDCPDGQCVVAAIEAQFRALRDGRSDEARLKALKYLVHFVADVHQPLHAGGRDDRGGNLFQLQAFGRGTNLHALWDTALVERLDGPGGRLMTELRRRPLPPDTSVGTAAAWAEESCAIAASADFCPPRHLTEAYADRFADVVRGRLHLAGLRLAKILDAALVERSP